MGMRLRMLCAIARVAERKQQERDRFGAEVSSSLSGAQAMAADSANDTELHSYLPLGTSTARCRIIGLERARRANRFGVERANMSSDLRGVSHTLAGNSSPLSSSTMFRAGLQLGESRHVASSCFSAHG